MRDADQETRIGQIPVFTIGIPLVKPAKCTNNHAKFIKTKIFQRIFNIFTQIQKQMKSIVLKFNGSPESFPTTQNKLVYFLDKNFLTPNS